MNLESLGIAGFAAANGQLAFVYPWIRNGKDELVYGQVCFADRARSFSGRFFSKAVRAALDPGLYFDVSNFYHRRADFFALSQSSRADRAVAADWIGWSGVDSVVAQVEKHPDESANEDCGQQE